MELVWQAWHFLTELSPEIPHLDGTRSEAQSQAAMRTHELSQGLYTARHTMLSLVFDALTACASHALQMRSGHMLRSTHSFTCVALEYTMGLMQRMPWPTFARYRIHIL